MPPSLTQNLSSSFSLSSIERSNELVSVEATEFVRLCSGLRLDNVDVSLDVLTKLPVSDDDIKLVLLMLESETPEPEILRSLQLPVVVLEPLKVLEDELDKLRTLDLELDVKLEDLETLDRETLLGLNAVEFPWIWSCIHISSLRWSLDSYYDQAMYASSIRSDVSALKR